MTVELPEDLSPQALEAIERFLKRCQERFTGSVNYDFSEGIPVVERGTDTYRFRCPPARRT